MQCRPQETSSVTQRVIPSIERLLQALSHLSPRQAAFFLLHFDNCFARVTGRQPTDTERLIVVAALRRTALANA